MRQPVLAGQPVKLKVRMDVQQVPGLKTSTVWGKLQGTTDELSYIEAHRDVLYSRVGDAVREVCNFDQVRGPGTDYRTCSSKSWTGAMPQMYRAFIQHYQRAQVRR